MSPFIAVFAGFLAAVIALGCVVHGLRIAARGGSFESIRPFSPPAGRWTFIGLAIVLLDGFGLIVWLAGR